MRYTYRFVLFCFLPGVALAGSGDLGIFTNSADIGAPSLKGTANFARGEYHVSGSGANVWGKQDQFHYVWRELSGNFTMNATVRFTGEGAAHRKAGIMVRQSLDPNSTYADVVVHGNGMPALQWRSQTGDVTNTFDLPFEKPNTVRLKMVRTGVKVYMYVSTDGSQPKKIVNTEVSFQNPVLVGLVICSHDAHSTDTAEFSDVSIEEQASPDAKLP